MLWALFKKKFFFQKILIEDWRISQKNLAPLGKKIDLLPDEVKYFMFEIRFFIQIKHNCIFSLLSYPWFYFTECPLLWVPHARADAFLAQGIHSVQRQIALW